MPRKSSEEQIEELVVIVGRGFEHLTNQLSEVNLQLSQRLDSVDQRLNALEHRMDSIEHRLERVEFLITGQDQRISILEDKMRQLATKLGYRFN